MSVAASDELTVRRERNALRPSRMANDGANALTVRHLPTADGAGIMKRGEDFAVTAERERPASMRFRQCLNHLARADIDQDHILVRPRAEPSWRTDSEQPAIGRERGVRATKVGSLVLTADRHLEFPNRPAGCHIKYGELRMLVTG